VEDFANLEDLGVQGIVTDGEVTHAVLVGRPQLLQDWSQPLPDELEEALAAAQATGGTAVAVGWDGKARGVVVFADAIKSTLRRGRRTVPRPRADPDAAHRRQPHRGPDVATEVGIDPDAVISEVLPADKVDVVKRLRDKGNLFWAFA